MGTGRNEEHHQDSAPGPGQYDSALDRGRAAFMAGKYKEKIHANDFVPGPG